MRFVPAVEANQLSRSTWRISVSDALPAITDGGTVIDGQAYSSADGNLAIDLTSNRIGPNGAVVGVSQNALPVLDQPELELRNTGGIAYGLFVDADNVEIHRMRIQAFGDPAARNSANIYVHDADGFQLTESHLRGAGSGNLIVSGGNGGLIEHNLIAAAGRFGILLDGATTTSNWVIRKNTIRNNALLRPSGDGIGIQDDANDIFVVMNLLIGNAGSGVDTWQNPGDVIISENTIRGNGWGGVETAGVRLFGSDNVVANNVITDNGGAGVLVLGNTGQANTPANSNLITQNHFGGNGTIAIDLTEASGDPAVMNHGDGITSNFVDPVQSGNEGISRPVITSSNFDGTTTTVAGMAGADQRVEIYLAVSDSDGSDNLAGDSFGEGVRYLGWVMTDGAGAFSFATTDLTAADAVTALAIDSSNNTSEFAKNIEVNAIPTSNDSSIWLRINDSFTFALSDFNFSDADGDSIHHVTIDSLPTNGTLTIGGLPVTVGMQIDASDIAAGDLVYSAPGITGTPLTSFDFAVSDGTASSVNYTMAIDVLPPNAPPTILAPSHISVAENDSFVTDVDAVDPENDSLTFGLGSSGDESFFTINANSGKISFVLPPDFESPQDANGDNTYEIEVLVDDNNNNIVSKTIEVHVQPINDNTPVLDLDPRYFVDENTNYVTHAQATDADLPAQSLSYSIDPSFLDGALFQIDSSTGEIQFVSSPDFEKPLDGNKDNTYRIRVSVSDGMGKSDSVAIRITVRDVNEPITDISLADDDVLENSAGGTRIGFVQVDEPDAGDTHTFQLLNDASGRFQIDANTGELTVQPNADLDFEAQQVHTIQVRVSDGVKYSFTKKFQIHVIDVNEEPVAIDDAFIVNEGGILVKSNGETLANDSDPDGDTLSGMIVNGPSFGQLNWSTDGSFVYVHDGSETTLDSFQYRVSDGRGGFDVATVTITINPVNDAPVANDDVIAAGETQSVLINPGDLLANDSDVDSTNLAVVVVANPSTGQLIQQPDGSLIFIPDANTPGIATFAYVASDGQDVSQPAVVTLIVSSPTNDPGEQSTDPPETNSQTDDGGTEPPDGENPGENPGGGEGRSQPGDESDLSPDGDNHAGFAESIEMHDEEDSQVADSFSENQRVSGSLLSTNYAFTYQKTSIDLSSLFGRSSGTSPFGELAPLDSSLAIASMWNELDHVNDVLAKNLIVSTGTIATAASLTGVLTVGYVLWMARGGLLVASLVSSVPAWQSFDPLPVLQYAAEEDNDEETESIESLLNQE